MCAFNTDNEHGNLEFHLIGMIFAVQGHQAGNSTHICTMNESTGHHSIHKIFLDPLQQELSLPLKNLNSLSLFPTLES